MKPANFPGRVNERRKKAFERLTKKQIENSEDKILKKLIVSDDIARDTRTKKRRSDKAKLLRT